MRKVIILIIALTALIGCSKKKTTAPVTPGTISGVVTDSVTGSAVAGAGITTNPTSGASTTDANGNYTIGNVPPANYAVIASKIGYCSNSRSMTVTAGNTSTANIALTVAWAGIDWVSIPAGNFTMGSTAADTAIWHEINEYPQHIVYLDSYQIDKYEVTNNQYSVFMAAGGYSNIAYWTTEGWTWRTSNSITAPLYWLSGQYNSGNAFPSHPVVGVNWYEAYAFCQWAGGHLPTEAQWEKAARYTDTRYYPWGSTWDAAKCNSTYNTPPDNFTYSSPVGYFSAGASYYGVHDMAGNVFEWVNDWYSSTYYNDPGATSNPTGPTSGTHRHFRGGSFHMPASLCRVACRSVAPPASRDSHSGFRVAR